MNAYTIKYKASAAADLRTTTVLSNSKEGAYYAAIDHLFDYLGKYPYSVFVFGVTYQNGNYKKFNNSELKPY